MYRVNFIPTAPFIPNGDKPLRLALIGGARVGKDTIGTYLDNVYDFRRVAFATELKSLFHQIFVDVPAEPKPREGYIKFGEGMRNIDPEIFIKKADEYINTLNNMGHHNIVLTDVRLENEIEYCRKNGFILVKVVANTEEQLKRAKATGEDLDVNNRSDVLALNFEADDMLVINNTGTIGQLFEQVDKLMDYFVKGGSC